MIDDQRRATAFWTGGAGLVPAETRRAPDLYRCPSLGGVDGRPPDRCRHPDGRRLGSVETRRPVAPAAQETFISRRAVERSATSSAFMTASVSKATSIEPPPVRSAAVTARRPSWLMANFTRIG